MGPAMICAGWSWAGWVGGAGLEEIMGSTDWMFYGQALIYLVSRPGWAGLMHFPAPL